jgi:hypothetical protein
MRLIGISGLAGSGKSEAAKALVDRLGFVEIALSDPMKRAALEWFRDWNEWRLWGPSERRNRPDDRYGGLTARKLLQRLGTEVARECYANVWVDYAIRSARLVLELDGVEYDRTVGVHTTTHRYRRPFGVVTPDVRYRNELEAIQSAGGLVIRIVRPGAGLEGEAAMHASEVEQLGIRDEEFDAVVVNNGSIEDLHERVCEAVRSVLEGA